MLKTKQLQFRGGNHVQAATGILSKAGMVGRVGFEPTTNWLKANCSTD